MKTVYPVVVQFLAIVIPIATCCNRNVFFKEVEHLVVLVHYVYVYNHYTQLCCNNRVLTGGSSTSCCGSVPYNPYTHLCCNGRVLTRDNNTACCGVLLTIMLLIYVAIIVVIEWCYKVMTVHHVVVLFLTIGILIYAAVVECYQQVMLNHVVRPFAHSLQLGHSVMLQW